jgi:hypothetical protein
MIAQPRRHGRRLTGSRPVPYGGRHPGQITLHQVVQHHLRTNLALVVWRRLGQARSAAHSESANPPLCRVWHPRLRWRLFPVARQRTFQRCPLLADSDRSLPTVHAPKGPLPTLSPDRLDREQAQRTSTASLPFFPSHLPQLDRLLDIGLRGTFQHSLRVAHRPLVVERTGLRDSVRP